MTPQPIRVWRLLRLFLHLCWGLLLAAIYLPWLQGKQRTELIRHWSRKILAILNIQLKVSGVVPEVSAPAAMFVANHVSWLDVWIINALLAPRFIAKSEVREWPLVGWLAAQAGVIFIQRTKRKDTLRVANAGVDAIKQGDHLCVFPEGTTTDGTCMAPFRSSLLQPAVETIVLVRPVALRYVLEDGGVNVAVAFIGEMTLWESMLAIAAQREIVAELVFLPPITSEGLDRYMLAQRAESVIAKALNLAVNTALEIPDGRPSALQ